MILFSNISRIKKVCLETKCEKLSDSYQLWGQLPKVKKYMLENRDYLRDLVKV